MSETTEVPAEPTNQIETDNSSVSQPTEQTEATPAQENVEEKKQEKEINFQRCKQNLKLLDDLSDNKGKLTTDLISKDKTMQTYTVVGADDQGNLILKDEHDQENVIPKQTLLADARTSIAAQINETFTSFSAEEQTEVTNQAHEAGFIMASDLEALIDSQDTKKTGELEKLLSEPIVSADKLGKALELIGMPHSAASITKSIDTLNDEVKKLNSTIKDKSTSPEEMSLIKAEIQKRQDRIKALKKVNEEIGKKLADENWSLATAYEKIQQGEISGQEFYSQYFAELFQDNEVQKIIDQVELSEEQKRKLKEKLGNGLKIGGGIIGILMILMIMQGMGGGQQNG